MAPADPVRDLMTKKPLMRLLVTLLSAVATVSAQQNDSLEQQLQQLKQQYADSARALEERIAALERQIATQREISAKPKEGTVSAAELAAQNADKAVLG